MAKRDAPATYRNREPILEVLARWLVAPARVLEVASGTGQHAVFFAEQLPQLAWLPTDHDPSGLESIEAWVAESGLSNLSAPAALDAESDDWPVEAGEIDAIFNANMIHISPWSVGSGLFRGAGRVLREGGLLLLYGPFKRGGEHTSPSNAAFDESLRQRDPAWGIRDLEEVIATADRNGLTHLETNDLPANNKLLVFRRRPFVTSPGTGS
jgi:SAM-dependent methyltransferase